MNNNLFPLYFLIFFLPSIAFSFIKHRQRNAYSFPGYQEHYKPQKTFIARRSHTIPSLSCGSEGGKGVMGGRWLGMRRRPSQHRGDSKVAFNTSLVR